MKIISFKDLLVWQKARKLTVRIYKLFSDSRDFGFRDQIRRASLSVMNNIAEGYARRNDRELVYFLRIAKASCVEVQSMIYLAVDLEYIKKNEMGDILSEVVELLKMLNGFLNSIYNDGYKLSAKS
ncbi:MAG: four helix bundle protein [Patescibacteria group bacterium]